MNRESHLEPTRWRHHRTPNDFTTDTFRQKRSLQERASWRTLIVCVAVIAFWLIVIVAAAYKLGFFGGGQ